jgi:hypothetical protein
VELPGVKIIMKKLMMINYNGDEGEGNEEKEVAMRTTMTMKLMKLLVIKKEVGDAKQEDAVELLERVETLQKQHNGNSEYLEEWGYIERYIGRAV